MPPWQGPSSPPAPPQGVPDGSGRPDTLEGRGHSAAITQPLPEVLEIITSKSPILPRPHRCHLISKHMEDAILCILDCLAKLGMEGLVVVYCGFLVTSSSSSSDSS